MKIWIALGAAAALLTISPVAGLEAHRSMLASEPWRLWLGPLRHADLGHLARDLAGLLGLAWLMRGRLSARSTALLIGLGLPLPALAGLALDASLRGYLGLSGLVHALCVVALFDLAGFRPRHAAVLGLALLGKLIFEASTGELLVSMGLHRPAVWGHVAGAALGLAVGLEARVSDRRGSADTRPTDGSRRSAGGASPAPRQTPAGSAPTAR